MTTPSTTPLNERDQARTPPSLFKRLDERWHFTLDAACSEDNIICPYGMFIGDVYNTGITSDSLKYDWCNQHDHDGNKLAPVIYCNPPYSRGMIEKFCKKAHEESLKGATVVMLLPADTSTKYFHKYCMQASEIVFINSRVHFNRPDGTPFKTSPKFGSMVVVFKQEVFDGSPVISSMGWK